MKCLLATDTIAELTNESTPFLDILSYILCESGDDLEDEGVLYTAADLYADMCCMKTNPLEGIFDIVSSALAVLNIITLAAEVSDDKLIIRNISFEPNCILTNLTYGKGNHRDRIYKFLQYTCNIISERVHEHKHGGVQWLGNSQDTGSLIAILG